MSVMLMDETVGAAKTEWRWVMAPYELKLGDRVRRRGYGRDGWETGEIEGFTRSGWARIRWAGDTKTERHRLHAFAATQLRKQGVMVLRSVE